MIGIGRTTILTEYDWLDRPCTVAGVHDMAIFLKQCKHRSQPLPNGELVTDRKARLWQCGLVRRQLEVLKFEKADQVKEWHRLWNITNSAEWWAEELCDPPPHHRLARNRHGMQYRMFESNPWSGIDKIENTPEYADQCSLMYCVFGNVFKNITMDPVWATTDVKEVARGCYYERRASGLLDHVRMSTLADALEEAGCTEQRVFNHLRGREERMPGFYFETGKEGLHCCGCHVLDAVIKMVGGIL